MTFALDERTVVGNRDSVTNDGPTPSCCPNDSRPNLRPTHGYPR